MTIKLARATKARIQKVFDKGVTACLKQGVTSKRDSLCRYRGNKGTKCFAGHLILDRYYRPELECNVVSMNTEGGQSVVQAVEKSIRFKLDKKALRVIRSCQHVHDGSNPSEWRERFQAIARENDLEMPTVKGKV